MNGAGICIGSCALSEMSGAGGTGAVNKARDTLLARGATE